MERYRLSDRYAPARASKRERMNKMAAHIRSTSDRSQTSVNGQFGKTLTTEADKFSIDNNGDLKFYNYKDVSEFGRYYVNKYGYKFHIKANGEEIKFFTPDARKIEKEFLELMASHGKSLEKKGSFFPSGTTYIVVGNAPEGKVKKLYCKKCDAEVDDDMLKCPNCHRLLSLDNAILKEVSRGNV